MMLMRSADEPSLGGEKNPSRKKKFLQLLWTGVCCTFPNIFFLLLIQQSHIASIIHYEACRLCEMPFNGAIIKSVVKSRAARNGVSSKSTRSVSLFEPSSEDCVSAIQSSSNNGSNFCRTTRSAPKITMPRRPS